MAQQHKKKGQRTSIVIACLLILAFTYLLLVGLTGSWFVVMNETTDNTYDSASVVFFPGREDKIDQMLRYGSLLSGEYVDPESGLSQILPGDSLLGGSAEMQADGSVVTHLSHTREFKKHDAAGTVIVDEIRYKADGNTKVHKIVRREQKTGEAVTVWYQDGHEIADPRITEVDYRAVTEYDVNTNTQGNETGDTLTATSYITTTTYTQKKPPENQPALVYKKVVTVTVTVTEKKAEYKLDGGEAPQIDWEACDANRFTRMEETILWADQNILTGGLDGRTKSSVKVTQKGEPVAWVPAEGKIPLQLGNQSTVPTNVKVEIIAKVGNDVLEVRQGLGADPAFYLGKTKDGTFVELFHFTFKNQPDQYRWTQENSAPGTGVWNLECADSEKVYSDVVPAPLTPEGTLTQAKYDVLDLFAVSGKTDFPISEGQDFEMLFNEMYSKGNPIITVEVNYYAKQKDFMKWENFKKMTFGG